MTEPQPEQRTPEWHTQRRNRITGSICGAILGHSPYMTREQAMRSLVRSHHGAASEFVGGPHIDWGVNNEDGAIWQFEMESGLTVEKCGFFPYDDFLGASPDGLIGDDAIFECKAPYGKRKGGDFKSINDQPHYYDQLMLEMLSTGRTKAVFYQWAPHDTMTEHVPWDQEWHDTNMPILRQFYAEYLSELDNPEHLEPLRREINTDAACKLIAEYDDLAQAIDNANERKKEVLSELIKMAGERDALIDGRKLTKIEKAGAVSYAAVVKKHCKDIDLEPFRGKPSEYWKLT